jgi:4-hydroxy-3-methylbut-2-enyl diphosphate reductase
MRVIRADVLGMCFGVRDALAATEEIADPRAVTIHGPLVHNEIVQERLRSRGFAIENEPRLNEVLPSTPLVMITAHGISDRERHRLESAGKQLIDTTCPLVIRVHRAEGSCRSRRDRRRP